MADTYLTLARNRHTGKTSFAVRHIGTRCVCGYILRGLSLIDGVAKLVRDGVPLWYFLSPCPECGVAFPSGEAWMSPEVEAALHLGMEAA